MFDEYYETGCAQATVFGQCRWVPLAVTPSQADRHSDLGFGDPARCFNPEATLDPNQLLHIGSVQNPSKTLAN